MTFARQTDSHWAVGAPQPQLGDVFDVLDFGSASNAFDGLFLPTLGDGLMWKTSDLVATGDFNRDGVVDGHDFLLWQRGESPDPLSQGDLVAWLERYVDLVEAIQASSAVPEPESTSLVAGAVMATIVLGARRRAPMADR